jgi:hypothetical protein
MSKNLLFRVFRSHKNKNLMVNLKATVADAQKLSFEKHKLSLDSDPPTEETVGGLSRVYNWVYNYLIEIASGLVQEYIQTQDLNFDRILYTSRRLRSPLSGVKALSPFLKTVHFSPLKTPPYGLQRLSEPIIQAWKT